jgi:hypothetical protein
VGYNVIQPVKSAVQGESTGGSRIRCPSESDMPPVSRDKLIAGEVTSEASQYIVSVLTCCCCCCCCSVLKIKEFLEKLYKSVEKRGGAESSRTRVYSTSRIAYRILFRLEKNPSQ